ncbi:MAG: four helix bundle protein [Lentisphaerae bacterium]|jgi:four helix bundle suffix protein|nr:four helix bundle protein [Lentisphaerota bacterium]
MPPKPSNPASDLIPKHGGFRNLKSFQVAQLVHDVTLRFCNKYINRRSRTHDQMVQAARSGVQNIAEGSVASATSKKIELKLTNIAKASLAELRLDYEDFLRQRNLLLWPKNDPRRRALVNRRCATADDVAAWVQAVSKDGQDGLYGPNGQRAKSIQSIQSIQSIKSIQSILFSEISANAALVLIGVATALLDRQVAAQAAAFKSQGGFTEHLYRTRQNHRHKS